MQLFLLNHISTYSILIAAIIGLVRYWSIHKRYRPFLFFIWLGTFNELVSMLLAYLFHTNTVCANIYVLFDYLALLFIFYTWNDQRNAKRYRWFILIGAIVWIVDNLVLHRLSTINSFFRVFYSLMVLFESIRLINSLLLSERKTLFRDPVFQSCMGFILFYSYKAFVETFYIGEARFSTMFYWNLFHILLYVNLITNLVYAIAVLCFQTKQEYSLRS